MAYINSRLSKWMPASSPVIGVDSKPRLSGIMDTINASDAHGPETKLPAEFFDEKARSYVDKIAVDEWYSGYLESSEYRRLGIGGLLGDVVDNMVRTAAAGGWYSGSITSQGYANADADAERKKQKAIRFALSGCHDTTIAGILASMGAFEDGKWPHFTSSVAIELFSRSSKTDEKEPTRTDTDKAATNGNTSFLSSLLPTKWTRKPSGMGTARIPLDSLPESTRKELRSHYVRVRYNDKPVRIPGCAVKPGNHLPGDDTFCTLEAFKAIVDKFTPRKWSEECMMNFGEGPFGKDDRFKEVSGY